MLDRHRILAAASSALACSVLPPSAAYAQSGEDGWADDDSPSRQELFKIEIADPAERSAPEGPIDLAIPKQFLFKRDALYDLTKGPTARRQNSVFGIDISHHSGPNIDFDSLKLQLVDFVYAKATQGSGFRDKLFGTFWKQLGALEGQQKVLRGAYHFLSATGGPGKQQAERFVDFVKLSGGFKSDDLPPCVDLEWDVAGGNPDQWRGYAGGPAAIADATIAWLERVEQLTGRRPIMYTAKSWWSGIGMKPDAIGRFDKYAIWYADYSPPHKAVEKPAVIGDTKATIWQFACDATLTEGYGRGLDANIFYGTLAEFKSRLGVAA